MNEINRLRLDILALFLSGPARERWMRWLKEVAGEAAKQKTRT